MKNPDQVPLTPVPNSATLPETIKAINKVIEAINSMWDHTEPDDSV
jgi:hypothetical protein